MLITIAGDDASFSAQLAGLLEAQSHRVESVAWSSGRLLKTLQSAAPDLLVVLAPAASEAALDVLRSVRDDPGMRRLPILYINPKGGTSEGVACLDAGADDFINRPFNPDIFLARVRTLLRRRIWAGGFEEDTVSALQTGPLAMRLVARTATLGGKSLTLTRLEFDLLAFLMRNAEQVFNRQAILEAVWNYPDSVETRTLDKHVETLRRKLGPQGDWIQTVHGVGYRFAPPAGKPSKT